MSGIDWAAAHAAAARIAAETATPLRCPAWCGVQHEAPTISEQEPGLHVYWTRSAGPYLADVTVWQTTEGYLEPSLMVRNGRCDNVGDDLDVERVGILVELLTAGAAKLAELQAVWCPPPALTLVS